MSDDKDLAQYRNGYGQAKADCLKRINELLQEVEDAFHNPDPRFRRKRPEGELKQKLQLQREILRWIRMTIRTTVKCPK